MRSVYTRSHGQISRSLGLASGMYGYVLPKSRSTAPKNASPWLPLRFNSVDGEAYGRGRVEEFLGDLKSLEALSQALVEGALQQLLR